MFWCGVWPGLSRFVAVELRVVRRDRHRPVAVLARAVDAGERLLVQQRLQAVAQRDAAQRRHDELVVVDATSVSSKRGAISNWHGATSLCRVTIGTPSL